MIDVDYIYRIHIFHLLFGGLIETPPTDVTNGPFLKLWWPRNMVGQHQHGILLLLKFGVSTQSFAIGNPTNSPQIEFRRDA